MLLTFDVWQISRKKGKGKWEDLLVCKVWMRFFINTMIIVSDTSASNKVIGKLNLKRFEEFAYMETRNIWTNPRTRWPGWVLIWFINNPMRCIQYCVVLYIIKLIKLHVFALIEFGLKKKNAMAPVSLVDSSRLFI